MGYGKIAVDTLRWDNAGTPTDLAVGTLATPADLNAKANVDSPTFTGDVTFTGAANNVVFDASDNALEFSDNATAKFGDSADLHIYHSGTHSYISEIGTGDLIVNTNGTNIFLKPTGNEDGIKIIANGAVTLYHDNSAKLATSADGVTVTGAVSDSKGDLRNIPQNWQNSSTYTLVASDAGKHIGAQVDLVVPASTFNTGDAVTIINASASDKTITCSAVTMYLAGDTTAKTSLTLAGRGMATVLFQSSSVAYISGSGLS